MNTHRQIIQVTSSVALAGYGLESISQPKQLKTTVIVKKIDANGSVDAGFVAASADKRTILLCDTGAGVL